jgi:hypothetical protein
MTYFIFLITYSIFSFFIHIKTVFIFDTLIFVSIKDLTSYLLLFYYKYILSFNGNKGVLKSYIFFHAKKGI